MGISTKGTYALRALTDMASNNGENEYICISSICSRLNVSRKYLESIMTLLSKNKLVDVAYGKCGGYKLNRKPEKYTLLEVLSVTEDNLKAVSCPCVGKDPLTCPEMKTCTLLETLKEMHKLTMDYLNSKSIKDLM